MGGKSQRKGAHGERELAAVLRQYGYEIRRGGSLSFGEVPDLVGLPGVHIEVKRVERLNVPEAMHQATRDSERFRDGAPAVFHRRSREPWLVTMRLVDWMTLYSAKIHNFPRKEISANGIDAKPTEGNSLYSFLFSGYGIQKLSFQGVRVVSHRRGLLEIPLKAKLPIFFKLSSVF